MAKQKKKKEKVLMTWWTDVIFTLASKIFLFFKYHVRYNRGILKEYKNRGVMLIYTHYSNKDHYLIKASTNYRRVNFVLASYFFFNKTLNRVLTAARAISKEQFKPDIKAIRQIKKVIDQNGMIAIAPAGQTSMDGNSPFISDAIVKLIRLCKCDVLALRLHGVYQTFPKWRKSKRKTRMWTEFVPVLRKEQLDSLTDEEIYRGVCSALDLRAFDELVATGNTITGKALAMGLEDAIVRCPKCGERISYESEGNTIKCSKCGNHAMMNKRGRFEKVIPSDMIYQDLPHWYAWQRETIGSEFVSGKVTLDEKVIMLSNIKEKTVLAECGEGHLVLKPDAFYYEGTLYGEPYKKEFKLDKIVQLPFEPNVRFEVPDDEAMFRFIPTRDIRVITEYVLIIDYLNMQREKEKHESNS